MILANSRAFEENESERGVSSHSAPTSTLAALTVPQLFDALSRRERVTVVTPNRRLAVYLQNKFALSQRQAGHTAWTTPDILPLATFIERNYRALDLLGENGAQPQLLDTARSHLLWEQVVSESDVAAHLLSIAQTARQAAAAWSVAHAWALLPAMRSAALFEDAEVFLGWAQRFQQLCRERDVVDSAALPTAVLASMQERKPDWIRIMPRQLFTAGFDITTPQQQYFLAACGRLGVSVQSVQPSNAPTRTQCHRTEFATEDAELRACAAWARQRLQANPGQHIAIVVPDLRTKRSAIARALTDALQPGGRAVSMRGEVGAASGFNISLGFALNEYALVHDALSLIAFSLNRNMSLLEVSALLRSPFIAGAMSELGPRARLDAALREVLAAEISLFTLQRKLKLPREAQVSHAAAGCPGLLTLIDRVTSVGGPTSGSAAAQKPGWRKPSPRDWSRHFGRVLLAWGFPGEGTLDSTDYQVLEKFRDALATLAMLETVQLRMRADEALNHLRRIVADTVFQPETQQDEQAPIQVLGILESAGQSFDALWVTGLSEDAWPLAARPNPFIPAALQRAAGVTEASAEASLALDERITRGWRACAPEVIFSHARTGGGRTSSEQQRAASALTRDAALTDLSALTRGSATTANDTDYARALFAVGRREPIADTRSPALPEPTSVRGGAAVLRDQAACPFRAFARHRLGAQTLGVPEEGLDASERGTLLHRVLCLLWARLNTHTQLMSLDNAAMQRLVGEMVGTAIDEAKAKGIDSLAGRFADIERARLVRLVIEWLTYERERTPFEVVACEQAHEVVLSGLSMRLRLDRLDRLDDGTHALIDYKTGAAKVAAWLGSRPDEPQLPLYFQTAAQTISVLAFARVKRGPRGKVFGFEGVSAAENLLPDVGPIETKYGMEKNGYVSWDVLIAEWEGSLKALATNFINGDARVEPKNGSLTCAQCDLQSLCRISALAGSEVADEEDSASDAAGNALDA